MHNRVENQTGWVGWAGVAGLRLAGCLPNCLIGWVVGWLIGRLAVLLAVWTGWLSEILLVGPSRFYMLL